MSAANFSSFFSSSEGENVVTVEKIKTSFVTTTSRALFNPVMKVNFVQLHPHRSP